MKPTRTTILIIVSAMLAGLGLPASPAGAAPPGPDEAIAFWTPRDGNREIYLTRADGTGLLGNFTGDPIAEDIDPAWSPDGTRIAFARRLVNKTTYDLFVMSSEGGGLQRVTTNSVDDRQPAWSPDGARIAFARGSGGDGYSQIFVINADGTGETPLTAAKAGKLDAEPTWSPDGTQIAFASDRDGTLTEIYTMFSDGSAQTKRTFNACIDSNPSWSPNGGGIAFDHLCPGESSDIWTMNATGGAQKNVTNTPSQEEFDPDWSPDGTRIAFGGYPVGGGNRDIYTMVADGSGVTRITDNPLSDLGPDWHRFPLPRCTVVGTTGDNVLTGTDGIDVICGLGGHDELSGLGGSDTLRGGDGKDVIKGGNGDDVFDGGLGADWADYSGVSGSAGVTVDLSSGTATGPQGTDTLVNVAAVIGSVNADTITGSAEDNTLDGAPGDDILNGGGGNDTADYSDAIKGVTVNLAGQGQPQATGQGVDTLSAFEHLTGSVHGDRLIGDGGANRLDGGEGGDTLAGAGGDDSLIGGPGDDVLDGGEGSDVGDYTQAPGGVTVNLSVAAPQPTGGAGSDHLAGIENLSGSGFPDRLVGSGSANTLTGSGSDDTLEGGDGKDLLQGGDGNDTLNGGDGDDRALGETGNDILAGSDGDDEVRGGIGQDNLSGDQGVDRLFGDSEGDVAAGGGGDDQVQGNDGPDVLSGGEGNDDVRGGAGGDRLTGKAGADKLIGEGGRDTITGGQDSDLLSGGDGNDRLLARDRLRDRVNGGPGNDRGAIDRGRDRVSGLESATKRRRGFRQRKRKIAQGVTLARIRAPGPRRIYVLTVRPKKAPSIEVALAQNALQGFERTSQMARRHRALAAINGDFGLPQGRPAHHFAKDGDLKQSSRAFGYNFAISRDELSVFLDRPAVSVNALETDVGEVWPVQRWNDGLPALGEIAGHSPAGGILETPPANTCSVRMVPSGPLRWGDAQVGLRTDHVVQEVSCAKAALPLNGGIVLSARPLSDEARLIRSLAPGEVVTLSWSFGWRAVLDSVGGFPLLVKDGAVVAKKCAEAICGRHPRTGVGITADGRLLLITVDGRRRGHSVGMTLTEFAREFERLGATWALNLDGGGSSTMVVRGKVVNRPSDKGRERFVSSAILVLRGPDVDEPAPLAAGAGGMGGEKRAWAGARSPFGSVGSLLAVRDPASTGGFLDALAGGELSPPGVRLPMDLRQLVRLFRSGR